MTNGSFLVLTRADVERLVKLPDAIRAVEEAFVALTEGKASVFPVIRERIEPSGGFFGVKAGYLAGKGYLGYKGGGFWASNRTRGIAGHQSVILLYDPDTGIPKALVDGNYLTVIRTGAAGALGARCLARKDSRIAAVIGAGVQGAIQIAGLRAVLPIEEVRCFDADTEAARDLAGKAQVDGLRAKWCETARQAIEGADVVVTATPSFSPVIEDAWIAPGTHINAFGADTRGKQELEESLFGRAKVVADYLPQCREIGECQHAFRSGRITAVHAELGEILAGRKPGRETRDEITVFDASGISLQDLAVAALAYETALASGAGLRVAMD